ncbi:MAG: hypothetical protein QJR12_09505 [Mycobacterium sp.]|uniref:hypothetical protein n=1 Tax=Mycobacterium sp. TaxID=1785 RepID=UPI00260BB962|nr:hypothetical protein [Mycobacterium sp.]MDI3314496.1 hypothetical protein [Mycobacterium sp.]
MIAERVQVGPTPVHVATAHWQCSGILVENSGSVDVFIDAHEEALEPPDISGVRLRPGERVTLPRHRDDRSLSVYAVAPDGRGEVTAYSPGFPE